MSTLSAEERLSALEAVFSALAHPARRQILLTVHFRGGSMPAGEIAGRFAHAWPTTTRHLKVLESAGLLAHEKVGRTVIYRIDRERLAVLEEWLAWFTTEQDAPTDASSGQHDISFFTDDLAGTVAEMKGRGVRFDDEIEDHGYGLVTHLTMPGGVRVQLYQPRYEERAASKARPKAKPKAKAKAAKPAKAGSTKARARKRR